MAENVHKVLFVNSEMCPYLPESQIATIARALPQGIQERKKEIRSFMPRYGFINERKNQLHEVIRLSGMTIIISDVDRPLIIKVASISAASSSTPTTTASSSPTTTSARSSSRAACSRP